VQGTSVPFISPRPVDSGLCHPLMIMMPFICSRNKKKPTAIYTFGYAAHSIIHQLTRAGARANTRTHARTHTNTSTRTRMRTYQQTTSEQTSTHTLSLSLFSLSLSLSRARALSLSNASQESQSPHGWRTAAQATSLKLVHTTTPNTLNHHIKTIDSNRWSCLLSQN